MIYSSYQHPKHKKWSDVRLTTFVLNGPYCKINKLTTFDQNSAIILLMLSKIMFRILCMQTI